MAAQRKWDIETRASSQVAPPPIAAPADAEVNLAIPSPAHALQSELETAFRPDQAGKRWSLRRTAALVVLSCGAFWVAVGLGISALLG